AALRWPYRQSGRYYPASPGRPLWRRYSESDRRQIRSLCRPQGRSAETGKPKSPSTTTSTGLRATEESRRIIERMARNALPYRSRGGLEKARYILPNLANRRIHADLCIWSSRLGPSSVHDHHAPGELASNLHIHNPVFSRDRPGQGDRRDAEHILEVE